MRRFRQLPLACLALALWLWGTQHCTLEAAGVLHHASETTSACNTDGGGHCVADGCDTVENGAYRVSDSAVNVPAPEATCPDCCLCLALLAPLAEEPVCFATITPVARDLNWVPAWHFARRTAPPSRAPSASLA